MGQSDSNVKCPSKFSSLTHILGDVAPYYVDITIKWLLSCPFLLVISPSIPSVVAYFTTIQACRNLLWAGGVTKGGSWFFTSQLSPLFICGVGSKTYISHIYIYMYIIIIIIIIIKPKNKLEKGFWRFFDFFEFFSFWFLSCDCFMF